MRNKKALILNISHLPFLANHVFSAAVNSLIVGNHYTLDSCKVFSDIDARPSSGCFQ